MAVGIGDHLEAESALLRTVQPNNQSTSPGLLPGGAASFPDPVLTFFEDPALLLRLPPLESGLNSGCSGDDADEDSEGEQREPGYAHDFRCVEARAWKGATGG